MQPSYVLPTDIEQISSMNEEQIFDAKSKLNKALTFYSNSTNSNNVSIINNINAMLDQLDMRESMLQYTKNEADMKKLLTRKNVVIKDPSVFDTGDIKTDNFNEDDW